MWFVEQIAPQFIGGIAFDVGVADLKDGLPQL